MTTKQKAKAYDKAMNIAKKMINDFQSSGRKMEIHMTILLFLKFLQSVVPTVQYDFTMDIRISLIWKKNKKKNKKLEYKEEFFDIVSSYEERLKHDKKSSILPDHPDIKKIEELVMEVNRRSLNVF